MLFDEMTASSFMKVDLAGKIAFVGMVRPDAGAKLKAALDGLGG